MLDRVLLRLFFCAGFCTDTLFKFFILSFSSADEFLELPHILSDEELADFELNDPFMSNFILQLDKQLVRFETLLVQENYKVFFLNF